MDNNVYKILRDNNIPFTKISDEVIRFDDKVPRDIGIFTHELDNMNLMLVNHKYKPRDINDLSKGAYDEGICRYLFGKISTTEYDKYEAIVQAEYPDDITYCACTGPLEDFMGTMYEEGELGW